MVESKDQRDKPEGKKHKIFRHSTPQPPITMHIDRRVADSFRDDDREYVTKYLDWIYGTISDSIKTIRRTATSMLFLIAIFELVVSSTSTKISIYSFNISRKSIVIQFIPAVVSYLYLQMIQDSISISQSRAAFSKAFEIWSNKSKSNDLDAFIWPSSPLYWDPFTEKSENLSGGDLPGSLVSLIFNGLLICSFLAFEFQAYYVLHSPHLNKDILWIISLSFSLFCIIASFALLGTEFAVPPPVEGSARG